MPNIAVAPQIRDVSTPFSAPPETPRAARIAQLVRLKTIVGYRLGVSNVKTSP